MLTLKHQTKKELLNNILPFWGSLIDHENGGFYGYADFNGVVDKQYEKGSILNSRILWTFATAYRLFKDDKYKEYADHARDFMIKYIYDHERGGLYWSVNADGTPKDNRKHFYNIAFGVYALSEHYRATGDNQSLEYAIKLFDILEKYAYDPVDGGYIEGLNVDFVDDGSGRLSPKDLLCAKSMNTNLHVLEALTNLHRVWKNDLLYTRLVELIDVHVEKIINTDTMHLDTFFDMQWYSLKEEFSYGHDIECSWLLYEAAEVTHDEAIISKVKTVTLGMAKATLKQAIDHENGGIYNGKEDGEFAQSKAWWVEAEAVVGFVNAYGLSDEKDYLDYALQVWDFTKKYFVDTKNGDWHNELALNGKPDTTFPKVEPWKCPYHNARMCFEIYTR